MTERAGLPRTWQRLLAWLLLLALLLAAWWLFESLYWQRLQDARADLMLERQRNERVEQILAQKEALSKARKRLASLSSRALHMKQEQPSTATSALQSRIKQTIESQSRARIMTLKPYPVIAHEGFSEVAMEIRMKDLSHAGLQRILHVIESQLPLMVVKKINIKRTVSRYKPVVKPGKRDNQLNVTLIVGAYFVSGGQGT